MNVADLMPSSYNPRTITDEKLMMLGKAMQEFGDLSGIVFNIRTGQLIGGHQRIKHLDPGKRYHPHELPNRNGSLCK